MPIIDEFVPSCPMPMTEGSTIQLSHGGGGRHMHRLLKDMFLPAFGGQTDQDHHDGAVLDFNGTRVAFTTDSYVVSPLFFPGGDMGTLAVNGTVNDLAMCGARPLYLSAGFVIEEGFPMETLWRIVRSMQGAVANAGVDLVTGDTKVVDKGKGDGLFVNTTGLGVLEHDLEIQPSAVRAGDAVLLSGDIGRHGTAVMADREGLAFECDIESDCAPLWDMVQRLLLEGIEVHCLRDATRGGLASVLVEIAEATSLQIHVEHESIPVREDVRGVCELLGLDPLYVANEGCFVAFVPEDDAERAVHCLRTSHVECNACRIGSVCCDEPGLVTMKSEIGTTRIINMLSGEQLPRIC